PRGPRERRLQPVRRSPRHGHDMATRELSWVEANQRYLTAALGVIRATLRQHAGCTGGQRGADLGEAEARVAEAAAGLPAPSALDTLSAAFGLSPFERDILLLFAGLEPDASMGAPCSPAE